jgi:hypothetical protein
MTGKTKFRLQFSRSAQERCRSEQSGKALGLKHVPDRREYRHHGPANEEADEYLDHRIPDFTNFRAWLGPLIPGTLYCSP